MILDEQRPLFWYEVLWSCLPLLLVLTGIPTGWWTIIVGLILGAAGTALNLWLFRSNRSEFSKFVLAALVALVGLLVYIFMAVMIALIVSH